MVYIHIIFIHTEQQACTYPDNTCDGNAICYSQNERCDGTDDCGDNSDELGCN